MTNIFIEKEWEYKGFPCRVVFTPMGHRCGYVGLEKEHPLYNKSYSDEDFPDLDVHGGITYTEPEEDGRWWIGFAAGHYMDTPDKESIIKYYGKIPSWRNDYFAIMDAFSGFSSTPYIRSLEYMAAECEKLIDQL